MIFHNFLVGEKKKINKPKTSGNEEDKQQPAEDIPRDQDKKEVAKTKPRSKKLKPIPITIEEFSATKAQHAEETHFTKLKLKKPVQKPKGEIKTVSLPKIQLKSRIKHIDNWPPMELKPSITFLGSVKQNGQLSRNIKEANKLKKKPIKITEIPDMDKVELERPETFSFTEKEPIQHITKPEENLPKLEDVQDMSQIPEHYPDSEREELGITNKTIAIKKQTQKDIEESPKQDLQEMQPLQSDSLPEELPHLHKPEYEEIKNLQQDELLQNEFRNLPVAEISETQPLHIKECEESQKFPNTLEDMAIVAEKEKPHKLLVGEEPNTDAIPTPVIDKKGKKIKKKEKVDKPIILDEVSKEMPINDVVAKEVELKPVIEEVKEFQKVPNENSDSAKYKEIKKKQKQSKKGDTDNIPDFKEDEILPKNEIIEPEDKSPSKEKSVKKLTPIKIERKELEISKPQHAESTEGPQFTKLKLKKAATKPKIENTEMKLPKFQLKSRIKYVLDWPPEIVKVSLTHLGSIRQNGVLSRNVKEAEKVKRKVYHEPKLPEIEKTELEKPQFGYEDIVDTKRKPEIFEKEVPQESPVEERVEIEEPEQFTITPKRPSIKKTEDIEDEVTIKKKLKAVRKPSITLPEITKPETVTFRPKTTKTKEDVEQEFNIHLDSYAEEEISMTSKVKLKPNRQPTFSEEADQASIKFYEEKDEDDKQDVIEILESDEENVPETANVLMPLKKPKRPKEISKTEENEIASFVTVAKPKTFENESEITEDVSIKLDRQPEYKVNEQDEVCFDIKAHSEQYTEEELSLSSKIKLKPKKKITVSEAADETCIQLKQEVEDDNQVEEIILSEAESEENVELFIKRKPKKPIYEVSEVEELSIELKPKKTAEQYEEEELTISTKRKPRKPNKIQGIALKRCVTTRVTCCSCRPQ